MKTKFTQKLVRQILNIMDVDIKDKSYTIKDIIKGMYVELEHGKIHPITNVTDDNIVVTMLIAMAHLDEFCDYYDMLEMMETQLKNKRRHCDDN